LLGEAENVGTSPAGSMSPVGQGRAAPIESDPRRAGHAQHQQGVNHEGDGVLPDCRGVEAEYVQAFQHVVVGKEQGHCVLISVVRDEVQESREIGELPTEPARIRGPRGLDDG
jgi:hypothetical protein